MSCRLPELSGSKKVALYNLTAVWRAGVSHKPVDCLSRHPVDSPEDADLYGESELDNCLRVFKQIANLDIDTGRDHVKDQHLDRILSAGNSDLEYTKLRTMRGEGSLLLSGILIQNSIRIGNQERIWPSTVMVLF